MLKKFSKNIRKNIKIIYVKHLNRQKLQEKSLLKTQKHLKVSTVHRNEICFGNKKFLANIALN